jgi:hypothetical protein
MEENTKGRPVASLHQPREEHRTVDTEETGDERGATLWSDPCPRLAEIHNSIIGREQTEVEKTELGGVKVCGWPYWVDP